MTSARLNTYTGILTFLVVVLAIANWNVAPDNAAGWIAAIVTMLAIWGVVGVKTKLAPRAGLSDVERTFFTSAVIFAGLLLAFSLAAKLVGTVFDVELALIERARNIFVGFALLYFANLTPKMIGPALKGKCSNAATNSLRRFSGWALALGALGYIGAWIFAPLTLASNIAHICVGAAVILTVLRILLCLVKDRQLTI